jgi:uncharacterized Fe-S center protein
MCKSSRDPRYPIIFYNLTISEDLVIVLSLSVLRLDDASVDEVVQHIGGEPTNIK